MPAPKNVQALIRRRQWQDRIFSAFGLLLTAFALGVLVVLLADLARDGLSRIDWQFLTSFPSRRAGQAGILAGWVGSLMVMAVTVIVTIPLGVAAGIYLEEYSRDSWLARILEINVANLAGVPSIIYGLLGLGVFVYFFGLKQSVLAAGLTLGILVLPIVIVATRESLRAIPAAIREASLALGATRWQTVRHHLLPYSVGGIATGVIIAVSRALGETAPLIVVGAVTFLNTLPSAPLKAAPPFVDFEWLQAPYTVLPIQMFNWVSRPQAEFHANAAAAGLVLIGITLTLNLAAIVIRYRIRRRIHW